MNSILDSIKNRRSCRSFSDKSVTRDDLMLLVEYGVTAPSAGNFQEYRFIVSLDRAKMKLLPDACMEQDWMSQARGVIIVCSQPDSIKEFFPEQGERMAIQGASAAIQNILLAAHELRLGACWVSGLAQSAVREIFSIPDNIFIEGVIPVGYPYKKPDRKTNKPFEQLVYIENFGNTTKDKDLLNKDYSIKIEKHIQQLNENQKSYEQRIQGAGNRLKDKFKEFFSK